MVRTWSDGSGGSENLFPVPTTQNANTSSRKPWEFPVLGPVAKARSWLRNRNVGKPFTVAPSILTATSSIGINRCSRLVHCATPPSYWKRRRRRRAPSATALPKVADTARTNLSNQSKLRLEFSPANLWSVNAVTFADGFMNCHLARLTEHVAIQRRTCNLCYPGAVLAGLSSLFTAGEVGFLRPKL